MTEQSTEIQILSVFWSDLAPHYRRGALWVFDFDLKEIATAIAEDQTRVIQAWIDSEALRKPEASEIEIWASETVHVEKDALQNSNQKFYFQAVIIQPFVVMASKSLLLASSENQTNL